MIFASAFLPELPVDVSGQGQGIDTLLNFVHYLMGALFCGWFIYFVYVLFRFARQRHPKADYVGVTGHTSSYAEVAVALIEVALLIGLAIPIWARTVENFPAEKDSTVVKIIAQQFQWNAWYPTTNNVFAKADMKLATPANPFGFDKGDPNYKSNFTGTEFVVPVDKPVVAYISSRDVIHSFACRPLRAMQDAIPGMAIPVHFTPKKTGSYLINCAQLCGAGHYSMKGMVKVVTADEYAKWYAEKQKAAAAGT